MNPLSTILIHSVPVEVTRNPWLINRLWARSAVGVVGGTPKSLKTWAALEMALAVSSGKPCFGQFTTLQAPVVLFAAEDSPQDLRKRVAGLAQARKIDLSRVPIHVITESSLRLDSEGHRKRLSDTLKAIRPGLVVLDPLVRLHSGDENSAGDMSRVLGYLRWLQREHDTAVLLVHHTRKSGGSGQPGQTLRGSGDVHAWGDSNLYLIHEKRGLVLHAEHRSHPTPKPMSVELTGTPPRLVVTELGDDTTPAGVASLDSRILAALREAPVGRTELRERLRVRNATFCDAISRLQAAGRVNTDRVGRLCVPDSPH